MEIGEVIRKRLEYFLAKKNMSRYRLSRLSGVSDTSIDNIVYQKNQAGSVKTILKICRALGITMAEFFDDPSFEDENINID